VGFQCSRFKRLGQAFEAGLWLGRAHGWYVVQEATAMAASTDRKVNQAF
jgi:hypothetical protein